MEEKEVKTTSKRTTKPKVKPEVVEENKADLLESKTTVDKNVNTEPRLVEEEPKRETPVKAKTRKPKTELSKDVVETKGFAWLAYILFFIPLFIKKDSVFVRHHANEGLEINIFDFLGVALLLIGSLVETQVNWIALLLIISTVTGIGLLVLTVITKVYMIITTLQGKSTVTPWMWNVRIIK